MSDRQQSKQDHTTPATASAGRGGEGGDWLAGGRNRSEQHHFTHGSGRDYVAAGVQLWYKI